MLGISVEPEQQVESQMNDLRFNGGNGMEVTGGSGPSSSTSKQPDLEMVLQIAPKIGEYLYNIMGSFFDDRPPELFLHNRPDAWQPTHDSTHVLFFHSLRFNPQAKNAYDYLSSFAPDSAPQTGPSKFLSLPRPNSLQVSQAFSLHSHLFITRHHLSAQEMAG